MKSPRYFSTIAALIALMTVSQVSHAISLPEESLYHLAWRLPIVAQVKVMKVSDPVRRNGDGPWQVANTVKVIRSLKGAIEGEVTIYTNSLAPKIHQLRKEAEKETDPQKARKLYIEYLLHIPTGYGYPDPKSGEEYILMMYPTEKAGEFSVDENRAFFPANEKKIRQIEQACNPDLWTWGPEVNGLQLGVFLENPKAYESRADEIKFKVTGLVLALRNKSDKDILILNPASTSTLTVNTEDFTQIKQQGGISGSKDTWTIAAGDVLPLPDNNRRSFAHPCELLFPSADELNEAKELKLTVTFSPAKDASGKTWQGELTCGPLVIAPQK